MEIFLPYKCGLSGRLWSALLSEHISVNIKQYLVATVESSSVVFLLSKSLLRTRAL